MRNDNDEGAASFPGNEDRCSDLSASTQPEMSNLPTAHFIVLHYAAAITPPASGSDYRLPTHHFPSSGSRNAPSDCGAARRLRLPSARTPNPHDGLISPS